MKWGFAAVLWACIPAVVWLEGDRAAREQLRIVALAEERRWAEVLNSADRLPGAAWNPYVNHEVNRALAHSGQMGERMFAYPQLTQALLLVAQAEPGDPELTYNVNLLLELGCVNMAEHAAMELLEVKGNVPFVLDWLATIYVVKGSDETAAVFLNRLEGIPACHGRAQQRLKQLRTDPGMMDDSEIGLQRASNPQKDLVTFDMTPDGLFDYLLDRNPSNRMAWDYRMAYYLLTQQVDKVVAHLPELDAFGVSSLPKHCAEALAIHRARGGQPASLGRLGPSEEVEKQAKAFLATYTRLRSAPSVAMKELAKEYGGSYFYYYTFGVSGVKE